MRIILVLSLLILQLHSFSQDVEKANEIIANTIRAYGGESINNYEISFKFRDALYSISTNHGVYQYNKKFTKAGEKIHDQITNSGFQRTVNGKIVELETKKAISATNSLNSVVYFVLIPFVLKDEAVIKNYLGEIVLHDKTYHKIKITFKPENGGVDHEDEYVYWIEKGTFQLKYLAYSYHVNEGGVRFRVMSKQHKKNDLIFQDYINYKFDDAKVDVSKLDNLYIDGELKEISRINIEDVKLKKR